MNEDANADSEDEEINWRQPTDTFYDDYKTGQLPEESSSASGLAPSSTIDRKVPFVTCENTGQELIALNSSWKQTVHDTNQKMSETKPCLSSHKRCIIHIDFDCFYCQVEVIRNPALKNRPFGVYQKHIVVSSNYVARGLGVKKMSTRAEALKICPEMILVNGEDLSLYREFSLKMFNLMKEVSPLVERIGFDENFIDVTKNIDDMTLMPTEELMIKGHCYGYEGKIDMGIIQLQSKERGNACDCGCFRRLALTSILAATLRKSLFDKLGLTSSAGIANSKILAKLIGKTHKPNQQTTILPTYMDDFLSNKQVREIPGIGSRCSKDLNAMGVQTINELSKIPRDKLIKQFGNKQGNFVADISIGIDNTEVNPSDDCPKSISEEESFRKLADFEEVKRETVILIKTLLSRLEKDKRKPRTVRLSLRRHFVGNNWARISRQANFDPKILKLPTQEAKVKVIWDLLVTLFDKMIDRKQGFDLAVINVGFTNFDEVCPSSSAISKFFAKENSSKDENETRNKESLSNSGYASERWSPDKQQSFSTATISKSPNKSNSTKQDGSGDERCNAGKLTATEAASPALESNTTPQETREAKLEDPFIVKSGIQNVGSFERKVRNTSCSKSDTNSCDQNTATFHVENDKRSENFLSSPSCRGLDPRPSSERAACFQISVTASMNEEPTAMSDAQNCPDGIDHVVFKELPPEIRRELMQNWKNKEHDVRSAPPKKRQKKSHGSNSILNYFSK